MLVQCLKKDTFEITPESIASAFNKNPEFFKDVCIILENKCDIKKIAKEFAPDFGGACKHFIRKLNDEIIIAASKLKE